MRIGLALMLGMGLLFAVSAQAQTCSKQTITGTYGVLCSGSLGPSLPLAIIGKVSVGQNPGINANFTGTGKLNFIGSVSPLTLNGTSSLNSDCTGTISFPAPGSPIVPVITLDFHVVDGGNEIRAMSTDPGLVYTCSFRLITR